MHKSKIKKILNSFRSRKVILIALGLIAGVLIFTIYVLPGGDKNQQETKTFVDGTKETLPTDMNMLKSKLSSGIDSVLSCFGIKRDWISAATIKQKDAAGDSLWFNKTVLIPNELSSIEVNADINAYLRTMGFGTSVSEDIITKDIVITVVNADTTAGSKSIGRVNVVHSDKVTRESAVICIVLSGISEYKTEEIEKLLIEKNEFSFVFPRNLDDIDIQNKLLQNKKDIIIDLTIGGKDNYDTDFNTNLDEKGVREKVKSFAADFPTIQSVILTKQDTEIPQSLVNKIAEEFAKFNVKVIHETSLTLLLEKTELDSKDKPAILATNLKTKASLQKTIVTKAEIEPDEFAAFYDEILTLKKLGYKFYNYSDYSNKKAANEKMEELKAEKLRLEQEIKKQAEKKKQTQIKKDKKKKTTDKKSTEKKKTTDKKKTDVKKKK